MIKKEVDDSCADVLLAVMIPKMKGSSVAKNLNELIRKILNTFESLRSAHARYLLHSFS